MTCERRLHIGCPSVRPVLPCVSGAGPGGWLTITFCSSCRPRKDVQIRDMPEQTKTESSRTFLFFSKGGGQVLAELQNSRIQVKPADFNDERLG